MMGFIEREGVMEKFADHVERSNNSDFAPMPTWSQAVQIVEDFPAADVRPVVHGKWEVDGHHIRCSICGEYMCIKDREGVEIPRKYCPNCGADMREES